MALDLIETDEGLLKTVVDLLKKMSLSGTQYFIVDGMELWIITTYLVGGSLIKRIYPNDMASYRVSKHPMMAEFLDYLGKSNYVVEQIPEYMELFRIE